MINSIIVLAYSVKCIFGSYAGEKKKNSMVKELQQTIPRTPSNVHREKVPQTKVEIMQTKL